MRFHLFLSSCDEIDPDRHGLHTFNSCLQDAVGWHSRIFVEVIRVVALGRNNFSCLKSDWPIGGVSA